MEIPGQREDILKSRFKCTFMLERRTNCANKMQNVCTDCAQISAQWDNKSTEVMICEY